MTGAGQPRRGIAGWIGRHPRGAGLVAVGGAVVLIGMAVVIGFALLSGARPTGTTDPTATPSASASPRPSIAASVGPSPSEAPSVQPSSSPAITHLPWPPAPDADGPNVAGSLWLVSLVDDLSIRSGPGTEHAVIGFLDVGDLALALDGWQSPDNWIPILADGMVGYAHSGPEDGRYLLPTPTPWKAFGRGLAGVTSDGAAYVAYGPGRENSGYLPYEGGEATQILRSTDGESWTVASQTSGAFGPMSIAPDGIVAVSWFYPGAQVASFSEDGVTWEYLPVEAGAAAVAHGPAGWVIVDGVTASRSTDGRTWSGVPVPISEYRAVGLEASDAGYLAFVPATSDRPWASVDGTTWAPVEVPIGVDDWVTDAELVGDRAFLVTGEADTAFAWLHRGRLTPGGVTWDGPPMRIDDGAYSVANISAGADGLLATGWSTDTLAVTTWSSADGSAWTRLPTSEGALGGSVVGEPAWGAAGWVTVGATPDGRGSQVWQSADGATWQPTGEPVAFVGPLPPCPPADEITTLVLMYLEPYASTCLDDASVTIRGWVPKADQLPCCWFGTPEPAWLAQSFRPIVQPAEAEQYFPSSLTLHVPDDVDASLIRERAWVEVTGHYRDAASSTCRLVPPRRGTVGGEFPVDVADFRPSSLTGAVTLVRQCEEHFVVEEIKP